MNKDTECTRIVLTCDNAANNDKPINLQIEGNLEKAIEQMSCALHLFIEQVTKSVIKISNIHCDAETVRKNEEALLRGMTGSVLALINKESAE